ncbi:MAG: PA4642 family protein [Pseudomonadales bacterium]|nr:PA4642 family protein [Pseudomonadales bacterium]
MEIRKDKKQVIGEVFDTDRLRSFLDIQPPAGVDPDYHVLEKAYRGMGAENFATFVELFVAAGRDLQARNPAGQTLAEVIAGHRHAEPYLEALSGRN